VLEPETRDLTEADWEQFLDLIRDIHRAHVSQPRMREGAWYLRHSIAAAHQDVADCAASALTLAHGIKKRILEKGMPFPAFEDLADHAIAFAECVRQEPRILSTEVLKLSPPTITSKPPQI
jgi:hypothetical protein